jgi:2-dehydropantoate 2-reductase
MLARSGDPVVLIGRATHVDAINRDGLQISGLTNVAIPVRASTDLAASREAGLVLFCTKTLDTESTGCDLARILAPGVPVLSLQNGVDNAARLRSAAGLNAYSVAVYIAAQMAGPGKLHHNGRGDLVLEQSPHSAAIASRFERAGIPCRVSDNVEGDLWAKLAMNCAYNAISALGRARYGRIIAHEPTHWVLRTAVEETLAVARAAGVRLPEEVNLLNAAESLSVTMAQAQSSTAQDLERGKRTEIDSLNGYIAGRGEELGVETPVNRTLHALVKLLEESM